MLAQSLLCDERIVQLNLRPVLAPLELLQCTQHPAPLRLRKIEPPVAWVRLRFRARLFYPRTHLGTFGYPRVCPGIFAIVSTRLSLQRDEVLEACPAQHIQPCEHLFLGHHFALEAKTQNVGDLSNSQQSIALLHRLAIPGSSSSL